MGTLVLASLASLALGPQAAWAAGPLATVTGTITAVLVPPISVSHSAGSTLSFGTFAASAGGTVTITAPASGAIGAVSITGGITFVSASAPANDSFSVTGQPNTPLVISTTNGTVTSGANTMSFTTTPMATLWLIPGTGASATASFTVGGTLTVGVNQPAGAYTGTYSCTVAYQ